MGHYDGFLPVSTFAADPAVKRPTDLLSRHRRPHCCSTSRRSAGCRHATVQLRSDDHSADHAEISMGEAKLAMIGGHRGES